MKKHYFTEEYLSFFRELASNNHKEWFDLNRQRYQNHVKTIFELFVADLIEKLKIPYSLGDLKPSDCIFRINRDIRFSKDKTPYKLQMSAYICKGGKKNLNDAGLYIEIGPEFLNIYSGFYTPEKERLSFIRTKIVKDLENFNLIIRHKDFIASFGKVQGERSKILPQELKQAAVAQPLLYNKQFYLMHQTNAETILKPGLLEYVIKHYKHAASFNRFLS